MVSSILFAPSLSIVKLDLPDLTSFLDPPRQQGEHVLLIAPHSNVSIMVIAEMLLAGIVIRLDTFKKNVASGFLTTKTATKEEYVVVCLINNTQVPL